MKRFYIDVVNDIIKNPACVEGENIEEIEIEEPFKEVSEEFYNQYKNLLPATFELDNEGNMINIVEIPKPEPIPVEELPLTEEQQRLLDLEMAIAEILGGGF